jgi:hypothetical protein
VVKVVNSIFNVLRFNQKNWKAVVLCVFAATVFWFFNALNKTYTTNIRFPLEFDYDRARFVPISNLPTDIRINVTGNGWALFRRSAGLKVPPLAIPLERPLDTKKIIGSTLPAYFSNQLNGLEINYVLTDTIYVDLELKAGKWISLTLDTADLSLREGFGLASNVSILPDSIFIEGPKALINKIKDPLPIHLPFKNIDEHFMEDVEVQVPSSDVIKRDPPTVAVMFNVQKFVTVRDSIQLVIRNMPKDAWPVIGRKLIPVTLSIPQNVLEQFSIDSAKAILDLKNLKKGKYSIKPTVEDLPPFAVVHHIDSVAVNF